MADALTKESARWRVVFDAKCVSAMSFEEGEIPLSQCNTIPKPSEHVFGV